MLREIEQSASATHSSSHSVNSIRPNNFDLIRLLAALQVVFVHGVEHLGLRGGLGGISEVSLLILNAFPGVPIFFVISGFLISRSYERDSNVVNYTWNRVLRIYPALWACFGVSIVSILLCSPQLLVSAGVVDFFVWAMAQLSIAQFYNPAFLRAYGVGVLNGSLWTIPVELQFYCAVPLLYLVLGLRLKGRNLTLIWITIFFLAFSVIYRERIETYLPAIARKMIDVSMFPYFWMFLVGVNAQRNWQRIERFFEGRFLIWLAIYCVGLVVLYKSGLGVTGNNQNPIAVFLLIGVVLSIAFSFRTLSERAMRGNDLSYGFYIYHMIVVNFLLTLGFRGELWHLFLVVCVTGFLAYASWVLVESRAFARKQKKHATDTQNSFS
jgi:peptidoglycan/LPS O-acetylase OafA/YrhL